MQIRISAEFITAAVSQMWLIGCRCPSFAYTAKYSPQIELFQQAFDVFHDAVLHMTKHA